MRAIGSGGMGVVYEARHRTLGRRVAVKVLHAQSPTGAEAEAATARFLREGRAAAQVRHPHVVDVFDFGVEDGVAYLVMELVEGETLAGRLAREGAVPLAVLADLMLPVISAIAELHAAGVVHRDLKPGNILLARDRSGEICPKVADFGLSRVNDGSPALTDSHTVMGTCAYMSPEQARSTRGTTERSDQYSFGVILYECATGAKPFDAPAPYDLLHAIMHAPLAPPSARNAALPPAFDALVLRAMSRDPSARFAAMEELGEALLPLASRRAVARWAGEFRPSWSGDGAGASVTAQSFESAPRRASSVSAGRTRWLPLVLAGAGTSVAVAGFAVRTSALHGAAAPSAPAASAPSPSPVGADPPPPPSASAARPSSSEPASGGDSAARPPASAPSSTPRVTRAPATRRGPAAAAPTRRRAAVGDNGAPILDPE